MASQTPPLALLSAASYFSVTWMKTYNVPCYPFCVQLIQSTCHKGSLQECPVIESHMARSHTDWISAEMVQNPIHLHELGYHIDHLLPHTQQELTDLHLMPCLNVTQALSWTHFSLYLSASSPPTRKPSSMLLSGNSSVGGRKHI